MNRLTKDQQNKILAIVIGTVVVIVGMYFGLIGLQQNALAVTRKKVADSEAKVKDAAALIKNSQDWQKAVDVRRELLSEIENNMVSGDPYSWIIRVVTQFKGPYKIDTPNFSPVQSIPVGILPNFPYPAVMCKIKALGYYHDIGKFLADFENQYPYMRVQNISIEPGKSGVTDESETLEASLEIVALVKPAASR